MDDLDLYNEHYGRIQKILADPRTDEAKEKLRKCAPTIADKGLLFLMLHEPLQASMILQDFFEDVLREYDA